MIRARAAAARSTRSATEEMSKVGRRQNTVDSMKFPITGEQRTDNGQHATADMQPAMDN